MKYRLIIVSLLYLMTVLGCSEAPDSEKTVLQLPEKFHSGEECHLCGMIIEQFIGPKGQLFEKGKTAAHKFCSTRDLFAFWLQPENQHRATRVLVHDMATGPWKTADDTVMIDAQSAWYVVGSSKLGAMGPTLASFGNQQAAVTFSATFGGRVIRLEDITLELLTAQ